MPDEVLCRLWTATADSSRPRSRGGLKLISRNGYSLSRLLSIAMSGYGTNRLCRLSANMSDGG
jgi:hypothetical protein